MGKRRWRRGGLWRRCGGRCSVAGLVVVAAAAAQGSCGRENRRTMGRESNDEEPAMRENWQAVAAGSRLGEDNLKVWCWAGLGYMVMDFFFFFFLFLFSTRLEWAYKEALQLCYLFISF